MFPLPSGHDVSYGAFGNAEFLFQISPAASIASQPKNFRNVFGPKFSPFGFFSEWTVAVSKGIVRVFLKCFPLQIFNSVVRTNPIFVSCAFPQWAWPEKSLTDEAANPSAVYAA